MRGWQRIHNGGTGAGRSPAPSTPAGARPGPPPGVVDTRAPTLARPRFSALFLARLDHALARAKRGGQAVAVLFLDLDRFKGVNDRLGHAAGDELLRSVAGCLRTAVRPGDTVARLGGDEFTILVEEIADVRQATRVAERVVACLGEPAAVAGHQLSVTTSIGIALSTPGADRPHDLLRAADLAMYRAKDSGKARYAVFDQGEDTGAGWSGLRTTPVAAGPDARTGCQGPD